MSEKERYTCKKCNKHFIASATAVKVSCPHCNTSNILRPELLPPEKEIPSWVSDTVPTYNDQQSSEIALKMLSENPQSEGWTKVPVNYEAVEAWSKPIALDVNKNEVQCTKATTIVDATPKGILNSYWNTRAEMEWNTQTLAKIEVVEDLKSVQFIYQVHKPNTRINTTNDLCYRRSHDNYKNGIWISCSNAPNKKPLSPPLVRANLVFGGFLIEPIDARKCRVTLIWALDINKRLQVQFVDEEPKRVALRLFKMRKLLEDDARLATASIDYEQQKAQTLARNAAAERGPVRAATPGTVMGCYACRKPDNGKFCDKCGEKLTECCATCYLKAVGSTCDACGNKLT